MRVVRARLPGGEPHSVSDQFFKSALDAPLHSAWLRMFFSAGALEHGKPASNKGVLKNQCGEYAVPGR